MSNTTIKVKNKYDENRFNWVLGFVLGQGWKYYRIKGQQIMMNNNPPEYDDGHENAVNEKISKGEQSGV